MKLKLLLAGVILTAVTTWAHHGSAGFDQKKPVHFIGKVSQLEWSNPHIVIHVDVAGADGKVTTWLVNTRPPNAAKRQGFSQSSLAAGTEISVDGYQALDGSNRVNGTNIALPDGRSITSPACFNNEPYCYKPLDAKGNQ